MALCCFRCGALLSLDERKRAAVCALCGFSRSFADLAGRETTYKSAPDAFLQRFGIESTQPDGTRVGSLVGEADTRRERATVDEKCISCGHRG